MANTNVMLVEHSPEWVRLYAEEAERIKNVAGDMLADIQHIGSTAIPGIKSKPIIDIAVLIHSHKQADALVEPLEKIGYRFEPQNSSNERHFFRKENPTQFHLSIAYQDKGTYWERQILFRDYLLRHPEVSKEYENLKINLLQKDPTGRKEYLNEKSSFIQKILGLARKDIV